MPKTTTVTTAAILLRYAEREYQERGSSFATADEMEMYRQDPRQMFTHIDTENILIAFIKEHFGYIMDITVLGEVQ